MRRSALFPVLVSLLLTATAARGEGPAEDVAIEVDAGTPGVRISGQLWGIFFEEINFAGDGGIYAELVRHRTFEGDKPLEGWSLVKNQAEGEMQVDPSVRLNDVRTQSLKVIVKSTGDDGTLGVVNSGYWGVPVKEAARYAFSLFARGDARIAGAKLRVSLRDKTLQKVYAEAFLDPLGPDWRRLECTLTPNATDMDGRLVISTSAAGTLWLDVVSLFPPTWKDQPNGLRPDLVKLLADLKPSFFRFPGGCFAEGRTLEDTFLFKETVGPIEQRKGRQNLWGYLSSDGLGYYEYLRLSEDLGADPIYCINPGGNNGCTEIVKFEELGPWLQTAVDAVEFAIGPAHSKWGAHRAAMGHPEPFACKTFYLQIGNETEFSYDDYLQRFNAYRARIKEAFPGENVKVIGDSWGLKHRQSVDTYAIDFHQYSSWQRAIASRDKYDRAPRGKPYVFEGEYATRSGSGILQALSEAVYMMGLEENGDEVVMAAYAPLFGHVNGCQWKPDLIYFDNHHSMGTISYYVQKMFSIHRGDQVLPLAVEEKLEPSAPPKEEKMAGSIGVGTWDTRAEYKDIRVVVDGKTVYQSDFSEAASLKQWKTQGGSWEIRDGALRQTSLATDCRAWLADGRFSVYELRMKARKTAGDEGFLIMLHVEGTNNFVWANLGGWGNTRHAFERCRDGAKAGGQGRPGEIETGRWYDVSIKVDGSRAECSLDGKRLMEVDLGNIADDRDPASKVYASAVTDESTGEVLLRVVNISAHPKRAKLSIAGLAGIEKKATAITLAAENLEADQQLDQPTRYQPVATVFDVSGTEFEYQFQPCSFTILRIKSTSPLPKEGAAQQDREAEPKSAGLVPGQPTQDD